MTNPERKKAVLGNIKNNFNLETIGNFYYFSLKTKAKISIEMFNKNPELMIDLIDHMRKKAIKKAEEGITYVRTQMEALKDGQ